RHRVEFVPRCSAQRSHRPLSRRSLQVPTDPSRRPSSLASQTFAQRARRCGWVHPCQEVVWSVALAVIGRHLTTCPPPATHPPSPAGPHPTAGSPPRQAGAGPASRNGLPRVTCKMVLAVVVVVGMVTPR